MRVTVTLSQQDIAFLDGYRAEYSLKSRSAVIAEGIRLLRLAHLRSQYDQAFAEWESSDDDGLWDKTTADGLAETDR